MAETAEPRIVQRAYRTEIDPTASQRVQFLQHAGSCRYIYNWALTQRREHYAATGDTLSVPELNRRLTALKQAPDHAWLYDVCNAALQNSIRNLDSAYKHFFRRVKTKEGKPGFPRYKSRKHGVGSFKVNRGCAVSDTHVKLPRIGWVKLKEHGYLPAGIGYEPGATIRMTSVTVSEHAGRWFVSVHVEEQMPEMSATGPVLAVHLGVRHRLTVSDGETIETIDNPVPLERNLRKLRRLQRSLSRKQKGSKNRDKARARVARLHFRVANIRRETAHQATTAIIKRSGGLILESWDVADMIEEGEHRRLRRVVSDAGMGELRRQLLYKADWFGVPVLTLDRGFPSTRRCVQCGADNEIGARAVYRCASCGWEADRDTNAVLNLIVAGKPPETLNVSGVRVRHHTSDAMGDEGGTPAYQGRDAEGTDA